MTFGTTYMVTQKLLQEIIQWMWQGSSEPSLVSHRDELVFDIMYDIWYICQLQLG